MYCITEGGSDKKKYMRNKHFFIAPFELTIAQWCYVNGFHKSNPAGYPEPDVGQSISEKQGTYARNWLKEKLGDSAVAEMRESYWKYLRRWEPEEWQKTKVDDGKTDLSDDAYLDWKLNADREDNYHPTKDWRPYYYATYKDVRGTP